MSGMSNEELARLIQNLIRIGTIMDIDHGDPPRVRVKTGNLQTDWRPWCERRSGQTKTWDPPTRGEQVILLSPGGDIAGAYILCSLGSDSNPPPSHSPDETVRQYPDGAVAKYNHATGEFIVTGIKSMLIHASDSITLKAGNSVTLDTPQSTSTGKHTIEGLLSYLAGMSGQNGEGGTTSIEGEIVHSGGNLSSNGVVVHLHIHGGVQPGGANTDGPK
ncbi:phage baseplate assembly protein V [Pusillimonas sp. NJUB218]|uniref:phage baseplate assembly protein V n=1 Tax=Pusillimonas sp. NJUB218 TaxID=2023230 RepID=UPI000F4B4318|nr:phage baseplate assembly protein V [Pusillimonas sp. NJUB218]ROT46076.1 baseplate assembly protein [Pusillimonas sp. NJUB218]